ncbi:MULTISPECIES: hypothetical protein [unclassified Streptomyces]|uniref:hypothetical protein n=1 Tax=unclassified Streptomyces TaxID=2593676 RepID=UPI0004C11B31|nr:MULTISPECIES: hypothetical protein [unclassified Streptomyces]
MTDHRLEGPGENGDPIPRDMPDQQADVGEDPWEVAPRFKGTAKKDKTDEQDEAEAGSGESADDVPDTDEAGTGRQGAPRQGAVHPEHPVPDEPAD